MAKNMKDNCADMGKVPPKGKKGALIVVAITDKEKKVSRKIKKKKKEN